MINLPNFGGCTFPQLYSVHPAVISTEATNYKISLGVGYVELLQIAHNPINKEGPRYSPTSSPFFLTQIFIYLAL